MIYCLFCVSKSSFLVSSDYRARSCVKYHYSVWQLNIAEYSFPVAQLVEHARSWVRFPGKARADKNVETVTWMQCKSLWIKASAKCINVNEYTKFLFEWEKRIFSWTCCNEVLFDVFWGSHHFFSCSTVSVIIGESLATRTLFIRTMSTYSTSTSKQIRKLSG